MQNPEQDICPTKIIHSFDGTECDAPGTSDEGVCENGWAIMEVYTDPLPITNPSEEDM